MRFSEDSMDTLTCVDGLKLDIHVWQPTAPKGVILAIHGGLAHGGDYVTPALYFKEQGFATVSYDLRGHNKKKKVYIEKFDHLLEDTLFFLQWVKKTYPGLPIFVMGHSVGGLLATYLGLGMFKNDDDILGYIISSPFYVNATPVPKVMEVLSGVLSKLVPKMSVPLDDVMDYLTHDELITKRHRKDEEDFTRAQQCSVRFAKELQIAQSGLPSKMKHWNSELFAVVAGDDKLANSQGTRQILDKIDQNLLTYQFHENNYHENFNEVNRNEIFADIYHWIQLQIRKKEAVNQAG
jgi:alpha-beta hydrolase superfamily lysophospholipase